MQRACYTIREVTIGEKEETRSRAHRPRPGSLRGEARVGEAADVFEGDLGHMGPSQAAHGVARVYPVGARRACSLRRARQVLALDGW